MSHYRPADTAKKAVADALIEAELVVKHRVGEALIDADEFLDELRLAGWDVVWVGEPKPNPAALDSKP